MKIFSKNNKRLLIAALLFSNPNDTKSQETILKLNPNATYPANVSKQWTTKENAITTNPADVSKQWTTKENPNATYPANVSKEWATKENPNATYPANVSKEWATKKNPNATYPANVSKEWATKDESDKKKTMTKTTTKPMSEKKNGDSLKDEVSELKEKAETSDEKNNNATAPNFSSDFNLLLKNKMNNGIPAEDVEEHHKLEEIDQINDILKYVPKENQPKLLVTMLANEQAKLEKLNNRIVKLNNRIVILQKETENLELFARRYACPVKLRNLIEMFPIRYLTSVKEAQNRLNILINKFTKISDPKSREKYLNQIVQELTQATNKQSDSEKNESFENAWKRLKSIHYGIQQKTSGSEDLGNMINLLYAAPNITSAVDIWREQEANWKSRSTGLNEADLQCITDLCTTDIDAVLAGEEVCNLVNNARETEFLRAFFKNNKSLNTPEKYQLCLWILFTSDHQEIKDILSKISDEWPNMNHGQRIHLYSNEFSQLFNIISELDKYGPGMNPPKDCLPESDDFQFYMHHLSVSASPTTCFVAKTLYSGNATQNQGLL